MAVTNVNLMGPNPSQPADLQAEQARLAMMQQISQALLAQGMSPTQMHDTGAVKTANWGDSLGKLAQTYFGRQGMDEVSGQQQGLAQEYTRRLGEDTDKVYGALEGGPGLVEAAGPPTAEGEIATRAEMLPGSVGRAIKQAGKSSIPEVREIAKTLLAAQVKFVGDQALTPATIAQVVRAGVDPASLAQAQRTGPWGTKFLPGGAGGLDLSAKESNVAPGTTPGSFRPSEETWKPTAGAVKVPPKSLGVAGSEPSPTGGPANVTPAGEITPMGGPASEAIKEIMAPAVKEAKESQEAARRFIQHDLTRYQQLIQLAQIAQAQGTTGEFGDQLNTARKIAARIFGFSNDDANKITNFESMMKLALTPAAHAGRIEVGGRYTQMEFFQFLKAGAASGITDPRTAQNIFTQGLLDGVNHIELHNRTVLPYLEKIPGITEGKILPALQLGVTGEQLMEKILPTIMPKSDNQPMKISFDPTVGWVNEYMANPQPAIGAKPKGTKPLGGGFTVTEIPTQ